MRNFYIELSSNRYTVDGEVTDWVPLPFNANRYNDDVTYAAHSLACREPILAPACGCSCVIR